MNKNIVLYESPKDIYTLNPKRENDIKKLKPADPEKEYITEVNKQQASDSLKKIKRIEGIVFIDTNKKMIFEETLFYNAGVNSIFYEKISDLQDKSDKSYISINNDNTGTIFNELNE